METAAIHPGKNKEGENVVEESQPHTVKQYETVDTNGIEVNVSSFIEIIMDDTKEPREHDDATEPHTSEEITETSEDLRINVESKSTTTEDSDVADNNQENENTSDEILDEKCAIHPGIILEYVCNDHEEVICRRCTKDHHSKCKSKGSIEQLKAIYKQELDDYLEKSENEIKEIKDTLADKTLEYGKTKSSFQICKRKITELHTKFKNSIQSSEDQLISRLSEIELKLERGHLTDVEILESTLKHFNDLVSKINGSKRKSVATSIVATLEGRKLIKKHRKSLQDIKSKGSVEVFFEKDPVVDPFLKSFNGAGKITEIISENIYDNDGINDEAQRLENFTLQKSSKSCSILVMPDNRILVSDETNGSIYCFGADGGLLFYTYDIKSPLGLCHMMWNFVVVVNPEGMLPLEVKDKEFSIKEKMSKDPFFAISFSSGYFVVCGENTIDVMNSHGHIKQKIPNGGGWLCSPLFSEPKAISFDDEDETKFYVTDGHQKKIHCMTIDGKKHWGISVKDGSPGEIACRTYIFVLCRDTRRIVQLEKKSGKLIRNYDTGYTSPCGIFVDGNMTMYMLETTKADSGQTTTKIIKKDKNEWFL